jgi:hypothetical protein
VLDQVGVGAAEVADPATALQERRQQHRRAVNLYIVTFGNLQLLVTLDSL